MDFLSGRVDGWQDYGDGRCTAVGGIPLVEFFEQNYGQVYVAVVTGNTFIDQYDFVAAAVDAATGFGRVNADIHHVYSDYTGYLWTEEEAKVGGHDFLKIVRSAEFAAILIDHEPLDFEKFLAGPDVQEPERSMRLRWS